MKYPHLKIEDCQNCKGKGRFKTNSTFLANTSPDLLCYICKGTGKVAMTLVDDQTVRVNVEQFINNRPAESIDEVIAGIEKTVVTLQEQLTSLKSTLAMSEDWGTK